MINFDLEISKPLWTTLKSFRKNCKICMNSTLLNILSKCTKVFWESWWTIFCFRFHKNESRQSNLRPQVLLEQKWWKTIINCSWLLPVCMKYTYFFCGDCYVKYHPMRISVACIGMSENMGLSFLCLSRAPMSPNTLYNNDTSFSVFLCYL